MKDLFSARSPDYAKFRPSYPKELVEKIASLCKEHNHAWDAGTGSGQLAVELSKYFRNVSATDISESQLKNAQPQTNVNYFLCDSCRTPFEDHSLDLITVAQAVHWFDFDRFYSEVNRVLKPEGVIALIGYGVMRSDRKEIDSVIQDFYYNIVGPYWDKERSHLDCEYKTIPFPFRKIELPEYKMEYNWNREQLIGYLGTWSALQHMRKATGTDPLMDFKSRLESADIESFVLKFPLYVKVGTQVEKLTLSNF